MKEHHILSLGAGVQSTALYLLSMEGKVRSFDCAIFADVGDEPDAVYAHVKWLQSLGGPPILIRSRGCIGDDLMRGENSTGQRFASIPAFTMSEQEIEARAKYEIENAKGEVVWQAGPTTGEKRIVIREGRTRRQCSREYKVEVLEKAIRQEIVGLKPRQRMPKDVIVHQYIGISLDEAGRARRIREASPAWARKHFPLIDMGWTRPDCLTYLHPIVPHQTPRSSCVFCPFHTDLEWHRLKTEDPKGWERAVLVDRTMREPGRIMNRNMDKKLFVHRSCVPLDLVQLDLTPRPRETQLNMAFQGECLGVCGV